MKRFPAIFLCLVLCLATTFSFAATEREEAALESAKQYLDFMNFSYEGLCTQLEYEGFTPEECKYAADHCGADWYDQAAESATDYMTYFSMSRATLVQQLLFEGFTPEEAEYGAAFACGENPVKPGGSENAPDTDAAMGATATQNEPETTADQNEPETTAQSEPETAAQNGPEASTMQTITAGEPRELSWGMTPDEAVAFMGREADEKETDLTPGTMVLRYWGQPISEFTGKLVLVFRDDALFARAYAITQKAKSTFTYLTGALGQKYGEASADPDAVAEGMAILGYPSLDGTRIRQLHEGGALDYATWSTDDCGIVLLYVNAGSTDFTALFYIQNVEVPETEYNMQGL